MCKEIATLRKIAQSWGGDIFRVTQKTFDKLGGKRPPRQRGPFYVGPFGDDEVVGIDWAGRRIYYVGSTVKPQKWKAMFLPTCSWLSIA